MPYGRLINLLRALERISSPVIVLPLQKGCISLLYLASTDFTEKQALQSVISCRQYLLCQFSFVEYANICGCVRTTALRRLHL